MAVDEIRDCKNAFRPLSRQSGHMELQGFELWLSGLRIARSRGAAQLDFLRRCLPYDHGVPGGRWQTILMNRIDPNLFSATFTHRVRQAWPDRPDFITIDGKTSRRSHDRRAGKPALHIVSAFATISCLVLGQEAVADKSNEITAIPVLVERLAEGGGLRGRSSRSMPLRPMRRSLPPSKTPKPSICWPSMPTNPRSSARSRLSSPMRHPAVSIPIAMPTTAMAASRSAPSPSRARSIGLGGDRRFPGELRLPGATTIIRVTSRTSLPIKKIDLKETYAAQPDLRRMSPGAFRQPSCRHSPPFE
jgi:hypothetical protein